MKNYMVTHTFKSKEAKAKMSEVVASMKMEEIVKSMTGENAKCQMTWNTPGETWARCSPYPPASWRHPSGKTISKWRANAASAVAHC